jgi:hypothetical protein
LTTEAVVESATTSRSKTEACADNSPEAAAAWFLFQKSIS